MGRFSFVKFTSSQPVNSQKEPNILTETPSILTGSDTLGNHFRAFEVQCKKPHPSGCSSLLNIFFLTTPYSLYSKKELFVTRTRLHDVGQQFCNIIHTISCSAFFHTHGMDGAARHSLCELDDACLALLLYVFVRNHMMRWLVLGSRMFRHQDEKYLQGNIICLINNATSCKICRMMINAITTWIKTRPIGQ